MVDLLCPWKWQVQAYIRLSSCIEVLFKRQESSHTTPRKSTPNHAGGAKRAKNSAEKAPADELRIDGGRPGLRAPLRCSFSRGQPSRAEQGRCYRPTVRREKTRLLEGCEAAVDWRSASSKQTASIRVIRAS